MFSLNAVTCNSSLYCKDQFFTYERPMVRRMRNGNGRAKSLFKILYGIPIANIKYQSLIIFSKLQNKFVFVKIGFSWQPVRNSKSVVDLLRYIQFYLHDSAISEMVPRMGLSPLSQSVVVLRMRSLKACYGSCFDVFCDSR